MTDNENIYHKRNAALQQVEESFGLDRKTDSPQMIDILNKLFATETEPWGKAIDTITVEDIKNLIIAERASQGDVARQASKPAVSKPTERREGESYKDHIRRRYTVKLKGWDYLQTAGRIMLFWADHPLDSGWAILTEPVAYDAEMVAIKASITQKGFIVATGLASATFATSKNFGGRIWEKAETAAIGRALAHCGYGTEEPDDDFWADTPIEKDETE